MSGRIVCTNVLCDAVTGASIEDALRPPSRLLEEFRLKYQPFHRCRCGLYPKRVTSDSQKATFAPRRQIEADVNSLLIATGIPLWKRVLDLSCILLALPALVPLMLLIALTIRITSPGPVFFVQKRIGYRGRSFNFLKFRSMRANADTNMHRQHVNQLIRSGVAMVKLDDRQDPRLFPAGRFLRATGLDELPQILNVLRGEMSLVGPRPCIPYEFEDYALWHKRRCEGLPGLTGLWQVEGKNRTTFEEMVWLDVLYLSKRSLRLDLNIIVRTIPALVAQARRSRVERRTSAARNESDLAGEKPEVRPQPAQ